MNQVSLTNLEISLYESSIRNQFTNILKLIRDPKVIYKYLYMHQRSHTNLQMSLRESGITTEFTNTFTKIGYPKPI